MRAWMWRQTETDAVLYTEDRQTLNSLLAYARFPYRDAGKAMTYARANGRVYGWQFTIPATIWNGVVRHLGRQAVTMLDLEAGRRRPTEPQPELPLEAVHQESSTPAARRKAVREKSPSSKGTLKKEALGLPLVVAVAPSEASKERKTRATKTASEGSEIGNAKAANADRATHPLSPVPEAAPKLKTRDARRGAENTAVQATTAVATAAVKSAPTPTAASETPTTPTRRRTPRTTAVVEASAVKPPVVEPQPVVAKSPSKKVNTTPTVPTVGKSKEAKGKPTPVAPSPAVIAEVDPASKQPRRRERAVSPTLPTAQSSVPPAASSPRRASKSDAAPEPTLPAMKPDAVGEKQPITRSRTAKARPVEQIAITPLPMPKESAPSGPFAKTEGKAASSSRKRASSATVATPTSEPPIAPQPSTGVLAPARKRGRKPFE